MKKILSFLFLFNAMNITLLAQNTNDLTKLWKRNNTKQLRSSGEFNKIDLDTNAINKLYFSREPKISIASLDDNNKSIITDLEIVPTETIKVKLNNGNYSTNINTPILYRGKVRGLNEKNTVLLTISPNYISFKSIFINSAIIITKEENENSFIQYNSNNLRVETNPFNCGTPEPDETTYKKLQNLMEKNVNKTMLSFDKTVYIFLDCTKLLYVHNGSNPQATINYIFTIWNDVKTAYSNEQLNVEISEINIWTNQDPFDTSTREIGIQSFAAYYQDNYWGNMAMLLDWNEIPKNGIAGGFGKAKGFAPNVCGNYSSTFPNGSYMYNDLNYFGNYQNFPVPANAAQVYSSIHEIGHLLGSYHTHNCNWILSTDPIVKGALDNCAAVEGPCLPGPAPVNGGTFMSYCINAGQYTNFNNGFGEIPGNLIRAFVSVNDCILNNTNCVYNSNIGAIPSVGTYMYEASNQITANGIINGNNATYVKIDAGFKVVLSPGFKATSGSKVKIIIDGCGGIR